MSEKPYIVAGITALFHTRGKIRIILLILMISLK
ncbi:MAG: hypothetical protein H6Q52_946 [Deltaproteobacteria bacterium]|nr:hypothetical protein [Deltaproteobacteria bacterium]